MTKFAATLSAAAIGLIAATGMASAQQMIHVRPAPAQQVTGAPFHSTDAGSLLAAGPHSGNPHWGPAQDATDN